MQNDPTTISPKRRATAFLSRKELVEFSQFKASRLVWQVLFEWISIIVAIYLCHTYWHPIFYVITVMWIGARMHGLGILLHEGAHFHLLSNRKWNDWVCEIFLAWPIFINLRTFRRNHLRHHNHINSSKDPDWIGKQTEEWDFPKSKAQLVWMVIRDLCGISIPARIIQHHEQFQFRKDRLDIPYLLLRVSFYLVAAFFIWYFGLFWEFLLYWFIPIISWLNLIAHLRGISEHSAMNVDETAIGGTRTILLSKFEELFIAPNHVNYHVEHHLYPSVPFYRLPELHHFLMQKPDYREKIYLTHSYIGLFNDCLKKGWGKETL